MARCVQVPPEEGEVDEDDVEELVGTSRQSVRVAVVAAFFPGFSGYVQGPPAPSLKAPLISPSFSGSVWMS